MKIANAIGRSQYDYLELTNQWAKVSILRGCHDAYTHSDGSTYYRVEGEPECSTEDFTTAEAALAEALRVLALYEDGRAD